MAFYQAPPELGNQWTDDRVLRSYLARVLPEEVRRAEEPSLEALGALAGGRLYRTQLEERLLEPTFEAWDAWGRRVDRIRPTPGWEAARRVACEHGVVATAYERAWGAASRVLQFARVYLFEPSSDVYSCPLAMTDGAAKTLLAHGATRLAERAVPRLTSRDPALAWTSGQWMTERTGGSDVGLSETVARRDPDGSLRLHGTKWFTSATTSEVALTLARIEGAPPGGRGLSLFYVETFAEGAEGRPGILVNRLKDKLGTRKLPTAELTLDGVRGELVAGEGNGVRNIAPMLNVTRTWNAVTAASGMRRAVALVRAYGRLRVQFGAPLAEKPLHLDTVAGMQAELEVGFHLAFRLAELLGREEAGEATEHELRLLRVITPLAKLLTGKQAVAVASEALECFGGAGYVEDTGIPRLLRDAQVLPIWEGTTNVLSLDVLKLLVSPEAGAGRALAAEVERLLGELGDARAQRAGEAARVAVRRVEAFLAQRAASAWPVVEGSARAVALTLARSLALALALRHADWSLRVERDGRALLAALRFARHGVEAPLHPSTLDDGRALGADLPAPGEIEPEEPPHTVRGEVFEAG